MAAGEAAACAHTARDKEHNAGQNWVTSVAGNRAVLSHALLPNPKGSKIVCQLKIRKGAFVYPESRL
jgi:hypothetical protein